MIAPIVAVLLFSVLAKDGISHLGETGIVVGSAGLGLVSMILGQAIGSLYTLLSGIILAIVFTRAGAHLFVRTRERDLAEGYLAEAY